MSAEMTPENAAKLRKAFPKESVGRLPKGGTMLDYIGHAATTDRLLSVDPSWTWEPLALDSVGLPAIDQAGNLWIKLTVCGVTRIGVGDGKNMKERIGDALRNAAMRFGVALDLWSKEELEGGKEEPAAKPPARAQPQLSERDQAKARAWALTAGKAEDREGRTKYIDAALAARGLTRTDATADDWNRFADDLEGK